MNDEIQVRVFRPDRRFGLAVHVFRINPLTGKREVWYLPDNDQAERWVEVDPVVETPPSLYFPDEIALRVVQALSDFGKAKLGTSQEELLTTQLVDSNGVRDRLLALVEKVIERA